MKNGAKLARSSSRAAAKGPAQDPLALQIQTDGDPMAEKPVSAFRSILPQILAVNVKNVLLFGYGMTLGFPTILIPAILGGEGRESTEDNKLHLSKEEISWLSTYPLAGGWAETIAPSWPSQSCKFVDLFIVVVVRCVGGLKNNY